MGDDEAIRDLNARWDAALNDLIFEGSPDDLATMIEEHETIPFMVRYMLAGYLKGEVRTAKRQGKNNSALLPRERREVETALHALYSATEGILVHSEQLASERRMEEIEIRRVVESVRSRCIASIAEKYSVSESTIRQACKVKDISAWTQVWAGDRDLLFAGRVFDTSAVTGFMREQMLIKARQILDAPEAFDPFSE